MAHSCPVFAFFAAHGVLVPPPRAAVYFIRAISGPWQRLGHLSLRGRAGAGLAARFQAIADSLRAHRLYARSLSVSGLLLDLLSPSVTPSFLPLVLRPSVIVQALLGKVMVEVERDLLDLIGRSQR